MRKSFESVFSRVILVAAIVLSLFTTLSCEVGLGEAVDVSAPTIEIEYPPRGAVIRDWFVFAGTCKDDGEIAKVTVTVRNPSKGNEVTRDAEITVIPGVSERKWSVKLNNKIEDNTYNGWEFADGTYEISVVATDASGKKSGIASRNFDIDNTAPFFVIQKPGVTVESGNDRSPYGSTFSVTGTIADLHDIKEMKLNVYGEDGKEVELVEENVQTAGGTSVDYANAAASENDTGFINYKSLYGEDVIISGSLNSQTRNFSCSITLSDVAKVYQDSADSGIAGGNTTSCVYLYDDVYQKYLSSTRGEGLSVADLMNIMNGTILDSVDSAQKEKYNSIRSELKEASIVKDTSSKAGPDNRLAFTLNPSANPTYVLSGLAVKTEKNDGNIVWTESPDSHLLSSSSNVTATISAGLNNTAIKPNTIHVWLADLSKDVPEDQVPTVYSPEDAKRKINAIAKAVADRRERLDNKELSSEDFIAEVLADQNIGGGAAIVHDNSASTEASGTMLTVTFSMPELQLKHYYVLLVTGEDQDGLEFNQEKMFGFKATGTGQLPSVGIEYPENLAKLATSAADNGSNLGLTFRGDAINGDSSVAYVDVKITVKDETDKTVPEKIITGRIPVANMVQDASNKKKYSWEFSPSKDDLSQTGYSEAKCEAASAKEYLYTAEFTVKDTQGQDSTSSCAVHVDAKNPVVTINSISPVINDFDALGKSYTNGKIIVKGNIVETNLKEVTAWLYKKGEENDPAKALATRGPDADFTFTYEFDTSAIESLKDTEGTDVIVVIKAVDEVGNEHIVNSTDFNGGKVLTVNQNTDKPRVVPSNFSLNKNQNKIGLTDDGLMDNLFGKTSNNKISATITDDDGIDTIMVFYKKTSDAEYPAVPQSLLTLDNKPTSYTLNFTTEAMDEDKYDVKVVVTDSVGIATYGSTQEVTTYGVTYGAPYIEIKEPSDGTYKKDGTFTVSGVISNSRKLSVATVSAISRTDGTPAIGDAYETKNAQNVVLEKGRKFSETITVPAEESGTTKELTYEVTDIFNQKSTKSVSYIIDKTAPAFLKNDAARKFKVANADYGTDKWYSGDTLTVEGYFHDQHSGVKVVKYELTPDGYTEGTKPSGEFAVSKEVVKVDEIDQYYYKFKGSISGFTAGSSNSLLLWAEDEVGNSSSGSAEDAPTFIIKMDDTAPVFEAKSLTIDGTTEVTASGTVTINGRQEVTLYGTITDPASGVGSIKFGGDAIASGKSPTVTYTSETDLSTWTKVKEAAYTALADGTYDSAITGWKAVFAADAMKTGVLTAEGVDGTTKNKFTNNSILSFAKDDEAPVVTFSCATTNVNGTKSITGTVTENYSLASMDLYYATALPSSGADAVYADSSTTLTDWTKFGDTKTSANDIYSWTYADFDFNDKSGAQAGNGTATIYILPVVKDNAGNTSAVKNTGTAESPVWEWNATAFSVDMNADRPVIQVTNLANNGTAEAPVYILKYGTDAQISGTLSDDDSTSTKTVRKFVASGTPIEIGGDGKISSSYTPSGSTTLTGNDWTFTPADKTDGAKTVYFYVEDNNGTVFYTGMTNTLYQPYFQFKTETKANNSAVLNYKSDCNSPSVESLMAITYETSTDTTAVKSEAVNTGRYVGGRNERYVQFEIEGKDDNGIAGMTLTLKKGNTVLAAWKVGNVAAETSADLSSYTVSGTMAEVEETNAKNYKWTTNKIDTSTWGTDAVNMVVNVYDNSGLKGNGSATFNVDNTAPTITITSPLATDQVTGDVEFVGTSSDTGVASIASVKCMIPADSTIAAKTETALIDESGWGGILDIPNAFTNWRFTFGKDKANAELDVTKGSYVGNGAYDIPVYVRVEDTLGNVKVTKHSVRYNPDADKPEVSFTYPKSSDYDKNNGTSLGYITLSGTIRTSGGAVIPSATSTVNSVYLQIGNETGTTFTKPAGTLYGYTVVDAYQVVSNFLISAVNATTFYDGLTTDAEKNARAKTYGFATKAEMDAWWGIKATGTGSWNIVLNNAGEMNPAEGQVTKVSLRACGVNGNGKFGNWTSGADGIIKVHVDDTAPSISGNVNQYASGAAAITAVPTAAATASQTYEPDMYLKGHWTLVVDVLDETSITDDSIVVKENGSVLANTAWFKKAVDISSKHGYELYIPINRTLTEVKYTISASDGTHTATQNFSFKIDEVAPTIAKAESGYDITATTPAVIQNSNYVFTMGGISDDAGSGVERVVFYYMRKAGVTKTSITSPVVMDPMLSDSTKVKVAMSGLETRSFGSYNLYAKKYEGTATVKSFTTTGLDEHVRVGGLVEIDGILRRITKKTGTTTVEFTPSLTAAKTENFDAYFPIAQVIDTTVTEKTVSNSANPFTFETGKDDGDLMPESFSKSGATWSWDATIHSDNLPDGPASLVILVFDKAGNVNGKTINTTVANNAPRIAKVYFGTDLSGDGKYTNTSSLKEIVEYSIVDVEGNEQESYTLDFNETYANTDGVPLSKRGTKKFKEGVFTIKNGLAVIPEIVGGNGDIGMVLDNSATDATKKTGTPVAAAETGTATSSTDGDGKTVVSVAFSGTSVNGTFTGTNSNYKMNAYTIAKASLGTDADEKGMSFTFWDSTDESTSGTDSQCAVLYVKNFKVAQNDNVPPVVVVNPFYWNKNDDNSLFENSTANGHIELEDDLVLEYNADGSIKTRTKLGTDYGMDPKVSGKIVVTGTAYDNNRLASLKVKFANGSDSYLAETAVSTYTTSTSSWSASTATLATNGYTFEVSDAQVDGDGVVKKYGNFKDDVYFSQKGHKVYWTLTLDTEKLLGTKSIAAKKDVVLTVTATDAAGKTTLLTKANASDPDPIVVPEIDAGTGKRTVTDGTTNVPTYQMDVVPYITRVTTGLSTSIKNAADASVYNRTAKGHYPVNCETGKDSITLSGFNLGSTTTVNATTVSKGNYTHTVDGVGSINNINNNNAKGQSPSTVTIADTDVDYEKLHTYAYNRKPNNSNNNTLTDDVVFDVWQFNSNAAQTYEGSTALREPVVRMNPSNGTLGFIFGSGSSRFSMPNKTNGTTYQLYQYNYATYVNMALCYDETGVAHGISTGIDTYVTNSAQKAGRMSYFNSNWGPSKTDNVSGNFDGNNAVRFECIGIPRNTTTSFGVTTGSDPILEEYRFYSPSIVATRRSGANAYQRKSGNNDCTTVYFAYYDKLSDQIRFRAGDITGTSFTHNNSTGQSFGQFYHNSNSEPAFVDNNYSVIAGTGCKQSTYNAGKYLCIDVIPGTSHDNDIVVAVWQDSVSDQLIFAYNDAPYAKVDASWITDTTYGWKGLKKISDDSGYYCQIKADADGNVHIACVNGSDEVQYTYIAKGTGTSLYANPVTAIVDSKESSVKKVSIDVEKVSGKVIPYITYFGTKGMPKMAYFDGGLPATKSAATLKGADVSGFSGKWESGFLPTKSKIADDDSRNNTSVCVSKVTPTTVSFYVTGSTDKAAGQTGNGTANPVVGYAVSPNGTAGRIEIAQKK